MKNALLDDLEAIELPGGHSVFTQGDEGFDLYYVKSGMIDIYVEETMNQR